MRGLVAVGLLLLALAAACGGGEKPIESLTAEEIVARSYEAMTQTSFAADVPPEPPVPQEGQPPYSIKYGPPDRLLVTGAGYEHWPYSFHVGKDTYVSLTGNAWALTFGGHVARYERLSYDPRELLRIATDIRDEGTQELDGKHYRVVTARRDFAKFADLYVTGLELNLEVEIPSACPGCIPPCLECTRLVDRQRLEALGYRNPDGLGLNLFKGEDIRIDGSSSPPSPDHVYFTIRDVRELSPALREEFRQVLEAFGADPALLDAAEVRLDDERERFSAQEAVWWTEANVRFWIHPKTFLVAQMEIGWAGQNWVNPLPFLDYGKVKLPEPEPAMLVEEVEVSWNTIQRRWGSLAEALETYAEAHNGKYPDEVTPAVLGEALKAEGLDWPENAFTGEPMKETAEQNPGDFHYEPLSDRLGYCTDVYDWYGSPIPLAPGPFGWEKCLPEGQSP